MDSCEVPPNRRKIASGVGEKTSSSSISKNDYEVFLSFRGPDTRRGFTDCLYHALIDAGIRVFRDDDELALGDKIDDILTALNNSKICIVVLSPTFAESSWCLREVVRMVDKEKHIVPIFYDVTPDDVKLKTELYANSLIVHETKHGKEQVQQWRDALKAIPTIKGRALKNTGYVDFISQITKEMLMKLKVKHKYEIKNLVQVPDEVESALKLLDTEPKHERRFLGIHGMGGIGKTTLARFIYIQILDEFDCSCFLENIWDSSQGPDGFHKLQERLLKSLDPSIQDGTQIVDPMRRIQTNFQRKKVFIVLDDVDQQVHLDNLVGDVSWFGEGSRIIFTTRNAQLHEQTTSSNAYFYGLEKKEMDYEQALTLFSRHAFGEDSPRKDFESLSTEVISNMGGLPLALEVVGSLLHRKKPKAWRDMIKKLEEAPHQNVQRTLKLSYDALEDEQQEIFLDIACLFIGKEKKNAIYMWEACGFRPNFGIDVLISMSLIKVDEKKCLWMHDQLRDFGRAIVNGNSKDVRRAGSRLWRHTDAIHLLKTNVGREKVEALLLPTSCYLGCENFVGLEKLRFLQFQTCGYFGGDFGNLIPKLRWLTVSLLDRSSFNVINLCLTKLVILELSYCRFDDKWPGWGQILISKQLKVLTLSWCGRLVSTPDLSEVVNLERLVLENCYKLTSIHRSLGKLQLLTCLSIKGCHSLYDLPKELTLLESLKQIIFQNGLSNKIDLQSIGCLVSLTRLEVEGAANLPNSIGQLVLLKHLCLSCFQNLRVIPDSIGDLRSLISLNLSGSGITELPSTIGRLAKLESLILICCSRLQRLPDSIRNLHSLIKLDVGDSFIPERSFLKLESEEFGLKFSSFESLSMDQWSALQQLKTLRLGCPLLELRQCQLPYNLVSLDLYVKKWGQLPSNLSSMKNLRVLKLRNFVIEEAHWVQGLECLEDVEMKGCSLMFNEFHAVKTLRKLRLLEGCQIKDDGLFKVVGAEGLKSSVVELEMEYCIITCLDITHLNHLIHLTISHCKDLVDIQGIGKLKSLTKLSIYKCDSLQRIEDLSELNRLESVRIVMCYQFEGIDGDVERLLSAGTLSKLHIEDCRCKNVGCPPTSPRFSKLCRLIASGFE